MGGGETFFSKTFFAIKLFSEIQFCSDLRYKNMLLLSYDVASTEVAQTKSCLKNLHVLLSPVVFIFSSYIGFSNPARRRRKFLLFYTFSRHFINENDVLKAKTLKNFRLRRLIP